MDIIKPFIEHILYPVMEKKNHNRTREYIRALQQSCEKDQRQLLAAQKDDLSRLLLHCIHRVPAYAEQAHLEQLIISDPYAALRQFPLLDKNGFRLDPDSFISEGLTKSQLIENTSGGSTGEPLRFYMDRPTAEHYEAARWRGLSWYGITPGSRSVMIWGNPFELSAMENKKFARQERYLKNRRVIPAYDLREEAMPEHVRLIESYRPEYIYGYAQALALFCKLVKKLGLEITLPLKAVVSTSETLYPEDRKLIAETFRAPVVNEYGARDGGMIAYQCPAGGLHLMAENLVAEVVSIDTHEPVAPGEKGLLAVTDLHNYSQPRLRYLLNDEVSLATEPCSCGRPLPCLTEIYGREDEIFVGVDGRYVNSVAFDNSIKRLEEVEKFQIIQEAPEKARVLMKTFTGEMPARLDEIKQDYADLLPGTEFTWELVEDIPPTPSGKIRYARREFPL